MYYIYTSACPKFKILLLNCWFFLDFHISDNSLYNNLNDKCHYYLESQFLAKFSKIKGFAVIHFNCRSVKSSFLEINNFLGENMRKFDIICLTEIWLTSLDNVHDFDIDGYEIVNINRENKRGGEVMMYV